MPQKIVGLDIGSYSIKAAVISSTFRNWEIVDFIEHRLRPEEVVESRTMVKATPIQGEEPDEETGAEQVEEASEESSEEEHLPNDPGFTVFSDQNDVNDPQSELRRFFERHGEDWEALIRHWMATAYPSRYTKFHSTMCGPSSGRCRLLYRSCCRFPWMAKPSITRSLDGNPVVCNPCLAS